MHYCIKLSGIQGEGVDTVGELLSEYLHNKGFHVYAYRNFTSRIRGGYSSHEIAFGPESVRAKQARVDLLIALDSEALQRDLPLLADGGRVIADTDAVKTENRDIMAFPIVSKAKEGPGALFKWTIALGVLGAVLGVAQEDWRMVIASAFERKGRKVVDTNLEALALGYELARNGDVESARTGLITESGATPRGNSRLSQGSEAIVESALAAGCNFISGYPISPASEVFSLLAREFAPDGPRRAVQTEDEISAVFMAIGASYAGAVPLVATSGPGFSLMVEGIGLAAMTKTPLVIINAQRTGPSTGMPTKHEQSDLALALAGGHGDVKPLVMAPSCIEDIYTDLPRAFALAEGYRAPVIFLTDFALMSARTDTQVSSTPVLDVKERRTRVVPGTPDRMSHSTGNQQGVNGLPTDMPEPRKSRMTERMKELSRVPQGDNFTYVEGGKEVLIIGIGSTRGAVSAAWQEIGGKASALFLRMLSPLPMDELAGIMASFARILVLDCNASAQLLFLLKAHFPQHEKFASCLRFDGEPFIGDDVVRAVKEAIGDV